MSESIPKYMLLDERSQEVFDRRIMPVTEYKQQGDRAITIKNNVITNTLSHPWKLRGSESIYNLQYSSKYGILLIATDNEVAIKTTKQLEEDLIKGTQNQRSSMNIKVSGELFLSPDEETLAICSETFIQFVNIGNLKKNSDNVEVQADPKVSDSNHHLWVDNSHFLGWKFQGGAVLYTIDLNTLKVKDDKELPVEQCTGASVIHGHLFIMQKMNVKIFEPLTGDEAVVKIELDMKDENHENFVYDYCYMIDLFKINIKDNAFTPNDVFGLVMVFYDEDEEDSVIRFLTFAKGDIFSRDSLEIRGVQNFYSTKTSRELFYINQEDKQKASFSIKRVISSGFICIMLEKSEKVYVIDPLEQFQKINIYDIKSSHQLKNEEGKFLQGMALMKNMLKVQRSIPEKADNLLKEIVQKYDGEFMRLFFKEKETNLTVAFPSSILAIGGGKFYRRYAINTVDAIDDDSDNLILEKMSKIKKSPHIIGENEVKKFQEKIEKKQVKKKEIQQEDKPKNLAGQVASTGTSEGQKKTLDDKLPLPTGTRTLTEVKDDLPDKGKNDNKTQVPSSVADLFKMKPSGNAPTTSASLFGNTSPSPSTSLFNAPKPELKDLFAKKDEQKQSQVEKPSQPTQENIFAKKPNETSLFSNSNVPNLFANISNPATSQQVSTENNSTFKQKPAQKYTQNKAGEVRMQPNLKKDQPLAKLETKPLDVSQQKKPSETSLFGQPSLSSQPNGLFSNSAPTSVFPQRPAPGALFIKAGLSLEKNQKNQVKPSTNNMFGKLSEISSLTQGLGNFGVGNNSLKKQQNTFKKQQPKNQSKTNQKANEFKSNSFNMQPSLPKASPTVNKQQKPSVPAGKPSEKELQQETDRKKALLGSIKGKISNFVSWQAQIFKKPSQPSQYSYVAIKQTCKKQEQNLKNLEDKIFGSSLQQIRKPIENSILANTKIDMILSNQSEQTEQVEAKFNQILNAYEEQANKMLYFINLLGKKKPLNIRASMSQSQLVDKSTANLRRITDQNEKKLSILEQQAQNLQELTHAIIQQKMNKRKKRHNQKQNHKGKSFNFQDFDSDEAGQKREEKNVNSHTQNYTFINNNRSQIRPSVISLNNINPKPKITLRAFEYKPPAPPKPQPSKKVEQQHVSSKALGSFVDKIPPKQEKVPVPIISKPLPKVQQQKQAISVAVSDDDDSALEMPTAKRQISSIQPAEVKGVKLSSSISAAEAKAANPPISGLLFGQNSDQAKKAPVSLFDAKKSLLEAPKVEDGMLFSQTNSMFNSAKGNPPSIFGESKKTEEDKSKPAQGKPSTNIFGTAPPTGGLGFNTKSPAPKETKEQGAKLPSVTNKEETKEAKQQPKPSIFGQSAGVTGAKPLFSPSGNMIGGKANNPAFNFFTNQPKKNNADEATEKNAEGDKKDGRKIEPKVELPQKPQTQEAIDSKKKANQQASKASPANKDQNEKPPLNLVDVLGNKSEAELSVFRQALPGAQSSPGLTQNIFVNKTQAPEKKAEDKPENAPKKEVQAQKPKQNSTFNQSPPAATLSAPVAPGVSAPNIVAASTKPAVTDEIAQSNNAPPPSTNIFNNSSGNNQLNANNPAQTAPTGFMNNSFGNNSHQAPAFGVGNNKFMNTPNTQQNKPAFDPNTANFGFTSSSNQKTFTSVGATDGNIFLQNQNAGSNQFSNQSTMFNQNNQNPSFNSGNNFNNNQGSTMFNNTPPQTNNMLGNQNNNNFANNSFNNNSPYSTTNCFNNNSSNNFGNNANTGFNNNNSPNMLGGGGNFGNNNNNNGQMYGNNNNNAYGNTMFNAGNNNQQGNFLNNYQQSSSIVPPAGAVSPNLMQMRK